MTRFEMLMTGSVSEIENALRAGETELSGMEIQEIALYAKTFFMLENTLARVVAQKIIEKSEMDLHSLQVSESNILSLFETYCENDPDIEKIIINTGRDVLDLSKVIQKIKKIQQTENMLNERSM